MTDKYRGVEQRLHSHGPYTRVYEKPKQQQPTEQTSFKYTSIIDVSSSKEKLYTPQYPAVIKTPPSISRVTFDNPRLDTNQITLNRPLHQKPSNRPRNGSTSSYTSLPRSSNKSYGGSLAFHKSQPLIPYLTMTNSLQLYLKLNLLQNDERIICWLPGSFVAQKDPFALNHQQHFNLLNLFQHTVDDRPLLFYPAYFLLTNQSIYLFRPKFRLAELRKPLEDEQTSYYDPSKLIHLKYKIEFKDLARIDVGPGRQYLVFHCNASPKKQPSLLSLLFQSRSKHASTLVIDAITSIMLEQTEISGIQFSRQLINQDVEWCIKNLQETVLLRPGIKHTSILSYEHVWDAIESSTFALTPEECDTGAQQKVTKVDFDFVKTYLFAIFLRYTKPVPDAECRGVQIQHVSILGTSDYIYLFEERLDVWPPVLVPDEFSPNPVINQSIEQLLKDPAAKKGLLVDVVPQIQSLLGVGRISDICRIERWRSWRIDEGLSNGLAHDFDGLGHALQNGLVGYFRSRDTRSRSSQQQGTLSGWFWWIRIVFGENKPSDDLQPMQAPTSVPQSNATLQVHYWWDLCFSSRESADDFIETIRALRGHKHTGITFVFGDD